MSTNIADIFTTDKSADDKRNTVLTNIVKMLLERRYIDTQELANEMIKKLIKPNNIEHDESKYVIKINNYEGTKEITSIIVKIIPYKITSVNKTYGISDFLNSERDIPKILVVDEVGKRAIGIIKEYKNVEIFEEEFLMINLLEHVLVPKHEKLNKQDKQKVLDEYLVQKKQLPKMINGVDPITLYFNARVGDIFRVIRPSTRTGFTNAYRLVDLPPTK